MRCYDLACSTWGKGWPGSWLDTVGAAGTNDTKVVHMEYTILQSQDIGKLAQFVNQKMLEGWKPVGGVAVSQQEKLVPVRAGEWSRPGPVVPLYLQALTLSVD